MLNGFFYYSNDNFVRGIHVFVLRNLLKRVFIYDIYLFAKLELQCSYSPQKYSIEYLNEEYVAWFKFSPTVMYATRKMLNRPSIILSLRGLEHLKYEPLTNWSARIFF